MGYGRLTERKNQQRNRIRDESERFKGEEGVLGLTHKEYLTNKKEGKK